MPARRLLAPLFGLSLAATALTAPATAAGTDWLALVEGWLSAFNRDHDELALSLEGLTLAEEGAADARLTFDALVMTYGKLGVARSGAGAVSMAEEEDGLLSFGSAVLEPPVTFLKAPGEEPVSLTFDLQRLEGLIDEEDAILRRFDLLAEEVAAERGGLSILSARRLALEAEVTPLEKRRYDQSALFTLQGVAVEAPDNRVGLERLVLRVETREGDPDAMIAWSERLQAAERGNARGSLLPLAALWRESGVSFLLAGLWAKDVRGGHLFWLEELRLENAMQRGSALDRLDLTFRLEASGLDFSDSTDEKLASAAGIVPTAWRLPLVVEDMPSEALGALLLELAAGGSRKKGPVIHPDRQSEVDFQPLVDAMRKAGSRLVVEDLLIEGPAGSLQGGGAVTLDRRHPLGMVGEASFLLGGIKQAEKALKESGDPDVVKFAFIVSTFLKGLGQAEVGDDGEIVYRYDLKFGDDGSSLLNGLPLDSLLDR